MSKFVRQWTPEQCADIIRRHIAGESIRAIAAEYECAPSTVSRLLRAPDVQAIIEEQKTAAAAEEKVERVRALDREKQARRRTRQAGYAATPADLQEKKRPSKSRADGRLLGYASIDQRTGETRWHKNSLAGGTTTPPPSDQELDALERKLYPERTELAAVVLGEGSRSYDPLDRLDIATCAAWITDLRPDLDDRDVRATLSTIEPGHRITFPEPEPSTP